MTEKYYRNIERTREKLLEKYPKLELRKVEKMSDKALKVYKKLLQLENIDVVPSVYLMHRGVDIFIPLYNIVFRYVDVEDKDSVKKADILYQKCYKSRFFYTPVYIRSNETIAFIMEKAVATIIKRIPMMEKSLKRQAEKK